MKILPNMTLSGYATLQIRVTCVQDLIDSAKFLESIGVDGSTEADIETGSFFVDLANGDGDLIACGDHVGGNLYDVVLSTHSHDQEKENPPASFDWMARDRQVKT